MNDEKGTAERAYYRVLINAPIDKVWSTLVKTDAALPFFFGAVCKTPAMEPGSPMAMQTPDGKFTSVIGEVLEFSPPHRYAHTMKFTNMDEPASVVTYELKEVEGGVEFTLITDNVPAGSKSEKSMAMGGDYITKNLKAYVETGKATFGARMMLGLFKLMAPMTPKACRSENWSFDRISEEAKVEGWSHGNA